MNTTRGNEYDGNSHGRTTKVGNRGKKKRLRLHIPKGTRLWIFERRLDCMILKHVSRLSVCKILH